MRECTEHLIRVGFKRSPKKIFDEIEAVSAEMLRNGWKLYDSCFEDGLASIHLLFERTIDKDHSAQKPPVERGIHEI
jgi:hypothetical protein